jgi:DNA-binding NarL/FixJ family response regulator
MLSANNNYDYNEREKKILELYDQSKSTRDIAKELRMSLRDISIILRKNQVSHGIGIMDNDINNNNSYSWLYRVFTPISFSFQLFLW